ncbi:hypothetical protein KF728_12810 [Candidatus Obscuribacterales bacterium]|nr:hypothetical protein [Candidatus Obscuribacterales bacterium]MBX3151024.1 hypothetical protein [Candidatus Obscuribacterales bacterium]
MAIESLHTISNGNGLVLYRMKLAEYLFMLDQGINPGDSSKGASNEIRDRAKHIARQLSSLSTLLARTIESTQPKKRGARQKHLEPRRWGLIVAGILADHSIEL